MPTHTQPAPIDPVNPDSPVCPVQAAIENAPSRQRIKIARAVTNTTLTPAETVAEVVAAGYTGRVTAAQVKKHRAGVCPCTDDTPAAAVPDPDASRPAAIHGGPKAHIEVGPDGGEFTSGALAAPVQRHTDLGFVLERFGLDPEAFEIVGDTVRMSAWDGWKRDADGETVSATLYSYKAAFRRKAPATESTVDVEALRALIGKPARRGKPSKAPASGVYVIAIADPQLGKKGTGQAVANWRRGVERHLAEVEALRKAGRPVEAIHVAFMGDETEGVCNNYGNQPHTVELNLSEQLELDAQLRTWTIREALATGLPVSVSSVISNHGEWTRNGGKDPVTTKADNASTSIARQVRAAFQTFQPDAPLTWHIADSDPAIIVELGGERVLFTHGHIQKGRGASTELRTKVAMERQILADPLGMGDVRLFVTAHYHHEGLITGENRYYASCPALEAEQSSEYMRDQYGVWSKPGMLGMVVGGGRDPHRPFTHWNIY